MCRKFWTLEELRIIDSGLYTSFELSEIFEVSAEKVRSTAKRHKLNYSRTKKRWTPKEEEKLEKLLKRRCTKEYICKVLDRNITSLNYKLRKLDKATYRMWEEKEISFLIQNYNNYTCLELGNIIGRSESSIKKKLKRLRDSGKLKGFKYNRGNPKFGREILIGGY